MLDNLKNNSDLLIKEFEGLDNNNYVYFDGLIYEKDDKSDKNIYSGNIQNSNSAYINKLRVDEITVFVTENCNLKCSYCYEKNKRLNIIFDVIKFKNQIEEMIKNNNIAKVLKIVFFGGEPILFFSKVKEIVFELNKLNLYIKYSISTNGTLLNDEVVDFFVQNNFLIMISLDAPKYLHDQNRRYKLNNVSTYLDIVENINKYSKVLSINIRQTLTKFNFDLFESNRSLFELGVESINFAPAMNNEEINQNDLRDFLYKFSVHFLKSIKNREIFRYVEIYEYLKKIHYGFEPTRLPCKAGINQFTVDVNSDFHLCHRMVNIDNEYLFSENSVFKLEKVKSFQEKLIKYTNNILQECQICWAQTFCGSCCYAVSFNENNNLFGVSNSFCFYTTSMLLTCLKIYVALDSSDIIFLENMLL